VSQHYTIEIGCLGHDLKETVGYINELSNQSSFPGKSKAALDRAAAVAIASSQLGREQSYQLCLIILFPCHV